MEKLTATFSTRNSYRGGYFKWQSPGLSSQDGAYAGLPPIFARTGIHKGACIAQRYHYTRAWRATNAVLDAQGGQFIAPGRIHLMIERQQGGIDTKIFDVD